MILRHELAHFRHGDLWKGALIRLLALPHWFNPLAWWIVRKLDECAEWLCDDEATGLDRGIAATYAKVLLRLGTEPGAGGAPATAMRGGRLHGRIRRVLSPGSGQSSVTKTLLLTAVPLALLAAHLIRVQIVGSPAEAAAAPARPGDAPPLPHPVLTHDEERAFRRLSYPTNVDFLDLPVEDAVTYLKDYHGVPTLYDRQAVEAANLRNDSPVTLKQNNVPLHWVLTRLLNPLGLDYFVGGPGLVVTTRAATAAAVRSRLERVLKYEIQLVDHLCELTDAQKQKLQLAGRGDVERLFAALDESRSRIATVEKDDQKTRELIGEMAQLARRVESGPFGDGSVFRKTLESTLTTGQAARYDPIRAVLQAGGTVGTLEHGAEAILGVVLIQSAFSDGGLPRLKGLAEIGSLRLDGSKVTDAGLAHLRGLTNLRIVTLGGLPITDSGVAHLKGLTGLEQLDLYGTRVTDTGLEVLKGLTKLQTLNLSGTKVADAGLANLIPMRNLQTLFLGDTPVTDTGLAHLQRLPKLRVLYLGRTQITDAGLSQVGALTTLKTLELSQTRITDAGLSRLRSLRNLQLLDLAGTQITDAGVAALKGFMSLRSLNLNNTKVSAAGRAELRQAYSEVGVSGLGDP